MFPGGHCRCKIGLPKEIESKLCLREELVPEKVGERVGDSGKDCQKVCFKSSDGLFSGIASVDIWWDKLKISVTFVFYGKLVGFTNLFVQDLEVNGIVAALDMRHDAVVRCETAAVVP